MFRLVCTRGLALVTALSDPKHEVRLLLSALDASGTMPITPASYTP